MARFKRGDVVHVKGFPRFDGQTVEVLYAGTRRLSTDETPEAALEPDVYYVKVEGDPLHQHEIPVRCLYLGAGMVTD